MGAGDSIESKSRATDYRVSWSFKGKSEFALNDKTPAVGEVGTDSLVVSIYKGRFALNPAIQKIVPLPEPEEK